MSTEQLEQRLAVIEQTLADVQKQLAALTNGSAKKTWQPPTLPPMGPEDQEAFEHYQAVCQYIRKTGDEPPPGWKPGDPIPDPEWWS